MTIDPWQGYFIVISFRCDMIERVGNNGWMVTGDCLWASSQIEVVAKRHWVHSKMNTNICFLSTARVLCSKNYSALATTPITATMKKTFHLLVLCALLASCNGQTKKAPQVVDGTAISADTLMPAVLEGNDNIKYGYPGGRGVVLAKQFYVILFDTTTLVPEWVTYHLTKESLQGDAHRKNNFRPDADLPEGKRSELVDYKDSEFDRGHMTPAADFKRSEEAMSETFFLSNMAPQRPNLNRIAWSHLENEVRDLVNRHGSIWIFTGPLYLDSLDHRGQPIAHIGPDNVAVPTHFFKVILCEHSDGQREMFAFIMKNQVGKLPGTSKDYIVFVRKVEELSGLNFFHRLPHSEETRLETTAAMNWPIQ